MTPFRTELSITPATRSISLSDQLLTSGSCFADDLGKWLRESKFNIDINPFGTTYNPLCIHETLTQAILGQQLNDQKFVELNQTWYHYDFHSQWSHADKSILQSRLEKQLGYVGEKLGSIQTIILTYGTAWTYEHLTLNEIVANCHKIPGKNFKKNLLSQKRIIESFSGLYNIMKEVNPDVRFILTVSPVRHLKDTMELNQVSKATLRLACHTISTQLSDVEYFPSYEIMMDDLRDYRFYKEDMIHPNPTATHYIAQKFSDRYFSGATKDTIDTWSQLKKAIDHKPFHSQSVAHQKFLLDTLTNLEAIRTKINVESEIEEIKNRLKSTTMA
jgi:hypothetical protein